MQKLPLLEVPSSGIQMTDLLTPALLNGQNWQWFLSADHCSNGVQRPRTMTLGGGHSQPAWVPLNTGKTR